MRRKARLSRLGLGGRTVLDDVSRPMAAACDNLGVVSPQDIPRFVEIDMNAPPGVVRAAIGAVSVEVLDQLVCRHAQARPVQQSPDDLAGHVVRQKRCDGREVHPIGKVAATHWARMKHVNACVTKKHTTAICIGTRHLSSAHQTGGATPFHRARSRARPESLTLGRVIVICFFVFFFLCVRDSSRLLSGICLTCCPGQVSIKPEIYVLSIGYRWRGCANFCPETVPVAVRFLSRSFGAIFDAAPAPISHGQVSTRQPVEGARSPPPISARRECRPIGCCPSAH